VRGKNWTCKECHIEEYQKDFDLPFKVPPRIRDDLIDSNRQYNEGDTVKFTCNANGTPKPNITWFVINESNQALRQLHSLNNNNYLIIKNITRKTPRYYYCRASNGIPPNDNRNFTFKINCSYFFFFRVDRLKS
jgi:hypothetical protein